MGRGPKPAKSKVQAKPPVGRQSPKGDGSRVRDLEKRLAEALEQQTATAEILRVISSSPTDIKPVLDAVARSAMRLCESYDALIMLREGEELHFLVHHGPIRPIRQTVQLTSRAISRGWVAGRAVLDRQPVHVHDLATAGAEFPVGQADAVRAGYRTTLSVPLLREGEAIGVIHLRRREVRPFTDNQIALLQTFADQAVIAIENVRLFRELQEKNGTLIKALDQQTATSEILRVISQSQTDVQPVFETIVRSAVRLCDGLFSALNRFDGELIHPVARHNYTPEALEEQHRIFPARPTRGLGVGRAILERAVVHIPDVELDPEYQQPALSRAIGFRSGLWVPMLREGTAIGVIGVARAEPGPFSDNEIELLKTFADQAVIAVENVRLFKELEARNHDLTRALDQQTATSDILRVISGARTDLQPVFYAIVESALRLLKGYGGTLTQLTGDHLELGAVTSIDPAGDTALRARFPQPLAVEGPHTYTIRKRVPLNIADAHSDPRFPTLHVLSRVRGLRSQVVVPMLRHDEAIGTISVTRREPGGFTDDEIALLQTFADQAVIAIENVRLFKELEARNHDLTQALDQQTATSDILRAISASPVDVQPVFEAIARNSVRLCHGVMGAVFRFDGEFMHIGALHGFSVEGEEATRRAFPTRPEPRMLAARAVLSRAIVHVPDVMADPEFDYRALATTANWRSLLVVPMLRGGEVLGTVGVARAQTGPFRDQEIGLLQTFADQAVIAIENVRLFTELRASNRELRTALDTQTATSDILGVISRSPTDAQPVFDAILASAVRLLGAY